MFCFYFFFWVVGLNKIFSRSFEKSSLQHFSKYLHLNTCITCRNKDAKPVNSLFLEVVGCFLFVLRLCWVMPRAWEHCNLTSWVSNLQRQYSSVYFFGYNPMAFIVYVTNNLASQNKFDNIDGLWKWGFLGVLCRLIFGDARLSAFK